MKIKFLGIVALLLIVASCASKSNVPTEEAKEVKLPVELAEGKNLYDNNCGACHKLYKPTDYTAEQWKPIVLRMQKKAELDDAQGLKIYNYLTMK